MVVRINFSGTIFAYGATSIGLMHKMIDVDYIVINKLLIKLDLHEIKLQFSAIRNTRSGSPILIRSKEKNGLMKSTRGFLKPSSSTAVAGARLKMVRESRNCTESCIKPLDLALQQFKQWVKTSFSTRPSSTEIIIEPLGVVGAIAAGNSVVLKPSEIAPATSSLLVKLFGEYLDASLVKVIQGSVEVGGIICKSEI
ncbi:hypothetical protein ACFE04_007319 [Oxalis oulophora]